MTPLMPEKSTDDVHAKAGRREGGTSAAGDQPPVTIKMPVDVRSVALTVMAFGAAILLLRYMQEVFIPIVIAALAFYALDPIVDWLEKRRVPRAAATAFVLLSVVATLGGVAYGLRAQTMAVIEDLPQAAQRFRSSLRASRGQPDGVINKVEQAAREIEKTAKDAVGETPTRGVTRVAVEEPAFRASEFLWSGSLNVLSLASQTVMILFLTYFLLLTDDLFKRKLVEVAGPTFARRKITVAILEDIAGQIERFLLVQVLTSLVVGAVTWATLWWLGLDQPAFWGFAAGVFNTIPYFGPVIVTGGLTVIAFMQFGTFSMAATIAGVALLITTLEGWLLTPALMSRVARMNPVAVFTGLIFWSWMWGIWGLLLAVPMLMIVKSVCDRVEGLQPVGGFLGE